MGILTKEVNLPFVHAAIESFDSNFAPKGLRNGPHVTLRGPKTVSNSGDGVENWDPVFIVDFAGRGNEEIFAEVPYYEGNRVFRYSLKPGKGVNERTLLYDGS